MGAINVEESSEHCHQLPPNCNVRSTVLTTVQIIEWYIPDKKTIMHCCHYIPL